MADTTRRCDHSDLPLDQCGGPCCRPDLNTPAADTTLAPAAIAGTRRAALHDGFCRECKQRIYRGEQIARTHQSGWIHYRCTEDAA